MKCETDKDAEIQEVCSLQKCIKNRGGVRRTPPLFLGIFLSTA
jgi:hypothetical protein